jgi:outer membrane receptor protein involved in Fe transport
MYTFIHQVRPTLLLVLMIAPPASLPASTYGGELEEIIVTAARREQLAQDVASTLQVFSGSELDRLGVEGFKDYLLTVPGVSLRSQNNISRIAMRGISNITGGDYGGNTTVSTVGIYLNDIPITGTSTLPDLALYDLNRVEVLKGPQGTLYGDGSMGGAIKMILNSPNFESFEGKADATVSGTEGGEVNYRFRGMVNAPLSDTLAFRGVGTYTQNGGYIDNVSTGEDNANDSDSYSVRATLKAQLTPSISAELFGLYDSFEQMQPNDVNVNLGDLEINSPEPRYSDIISRIFGATLRADLGFAELSSITSYYDYDRDTRTFLVFTSFLFGLFGAPPPVEERFTFFVESKTVSQEFRLVSSGDNRLDWVAGAFYRNRDQNIPGIIDVAPGDLASLNATLAVFGLPTFNNTNVIWNLEEISDEYEQYAVYGEASFELTEKLELTAGLRLFDETVKSVSHQLGAGVFSIVELGPNELKTSDDGIVPKFGLSYELTEDKLLYAQAAKGFRSSAINLGFVNSGLGELGADSDSLWHYEFGAKTVWLDDRFLLNGSVFYVDWSDMQLTQTGISVITDTPATFLGNGGKAEIFGFELGVVAQPSGALTLGLNLGYTDSELTDAGMTTAIEGRRLPNVPEWTSSGYLQYDFPVAQFNGNGYVRFDVQYVDEQSTIAISPLTLATNGAEVDDYALGTLRVGFNRGNWGAHVFVDNLWDERAETGRGIGGAGGSLITLERFHIVRPRTFGLMVSVKF